MTQFSGQAAIITGASGLLASGVIPIFQAGGANLALTCGDDRLYERMPELRDDPNHLCLQGVDLSDPVAVATLVSRVKARFGRIGILVNIVGGWDAGAPVHEMTVDTWQTMLRLNATITFLMCRAVIPAMLEAGGGKIVNIGARPALRSSGHDGAYAASKAAVLRLTESISEEYKRRGIRCNAVLPSAIVPAEQLADDPDAGVTPRQVGRVVGFLCSEAGAIINGALLPAYGTRF
ncbi:MAG: SDR family oxidoreductase [Chloroflexi bacterium]|nr:SDR family oxidoreductase [Chloroflexota bacterium]